jgi:hypothetical protein
MRTLSPPTRQHIGRSPRPNLRKTANKASSFLPCVEELEARQTPAGGLGALTLNAFLNNTPALVSFNDGTGQPGHVGTDNTLLTQINATYHPATGSAVTFNTFCIDLFHTVSNGQTYGVQLRGDLATDFTNGSRIAYVFQNYGHSGLGANPDSAAAVQLAIWDLTLNNHAPTSFGASQTTPGYYSSGDDNVFRVSLGTNPDADKIAELTNTYLQASIGATVSGSWFNASFPGDCSTPGQSMLCTSGSISGRKFQDINGNGSVQASEPGLSGWTILLQQQNGLGWTTVQTTTTADGSHGTALGTYRFDGLAAGTYRVVEVQQPGWTQTFGLGGYSFVAQDNGLSATGDDFGNFHNGPTSIRPQFPIVVTAAAFAPYNLVPSTTPPARFFFGEVSARSPSLQLDVPTTQGSGEDKLGAISGEVYLDANLNGALDPGEKGILDQQIFLEELGANGRTDLLASARTDGTGWYVFLGLKPGLYRVHAQLSPEYFQTNYADENGIYIVTIRGTFFALSKDFGAHRVAPPALPVPIVDLAPIYPDLGYDREMNLVGDHVVEHWNELLPGWGAAIPTDNANGSSPLAPFIDDAFASWPGGW